jgi:hypothetical protein
MSVKPIELSETVREQLLTIVKTVAISENGSVRTEFQLCNITLPGMKYRITAFIS